MMQRQVRNSQTLQTIMRIPGSAHRDEGGSQIEYVDEMTPRRGLAVKTALEKHTQAALNSDEGKDSRADRR